MMAALYPTKKALREAIGSRLRYQETSIFGKEYPPEGTGKVTCVGPSPYRRKWYAEITLTAHIITKVE